MQPTCNPPPLHLACQFGTDLSVVGYLLGHPDAGRNAVNARGAALYAGVRKYTGTPLLLAATYGRTEAVEALLTVPGVDVNARTAHSGRSALHLAAYGGHADIMRALLAWRGDGDSTLDWQATDNAGEHVVFSAVRGEREGAVRCVARTLHVRCGHSAALTPHCRCFSAVCWRRRPT